MTTFEETATIGQIVARTPQTARVFEALGMDYCCGGGRTLAKASERAGVPLDELRSRLDAAASSPADERTWTDATMTELADHIEATHHAYLREELPALQALAEKVARVHGERRPELIALRDELAAFAAELDEHMLAEETVLFPRLRRLEAEPGGPTPEVKAPIAAMIGEHEEAGAALERMRELTDNFTPPPDACTSYTVLFTRLGVLERDMHRHVHKENNVLFEAARRAIDPKCEPGSAGCCGSNG